MWDRLLPALGAFPSAVITALDVDGAIASVRTAVAPDEGRQVLAIENPEAIGLCAGPACLLLHSHNEQLWDLRSVVVRGALEQEGAGWVFRPLVIASGADEGALAPLRLLLNCRTTTRRYLQKRQLARPRIPWAQLKAARSHRSTVPQE